MDEGLRQRMLVEFGKQAFEATVALHPSSGPGMEPKEAVAHVYKVIEHFEKQEHKRLVKTAIEICDGIIKQISDVEAAGNPKALHVVVNGLSQVLVQSGQFELTGLAVSYAQLMKDQAPATMSMDLVRKAREMAADVRGLLRKSIAEESPA